MNHNEDFDWVDDLRYLAWRAFVVMGTAFAVFFVISAVLLVLGAFGIYVGG